MALSMRRVAVAARVAESRSRYLMTSARNAGRQGNKASYAANSAAGALAGLLVASGGTALCWSWPFGSSTSVKGIDYQGVYNDISKILEDLDYDDGSYGPVFVRLAWHAAGTYSKADGTGGSDGSTMRFSKEGAWGANAGLAIARKRLEAVKEKYPALTYADLWSLSAVVAIQEMGGPVIPWRPGRSDAKDESRGPPDGRLPDATKGSPHLRDIFHRMGMSDRDIVALSGAHALGRCHGDRSGFVGPWTNAPTTFSNLYFKALKEETWIVKTENEAKDTGKKSKWTGPMQYTDAKTGTLMMLPTDLALTKDASFAPWVDKYAADQALFFADFKDAFTRLQEQGVAAFTKADAIKPLTLAKA